MLYEVITPFPAQIISTTIWNCYYSIGTAYKQNLLLPLDELLPENFLLEQEKNSVGQSHKSYYWAGHQWALAADAAAQVSSWRPDIFTDIEAKQPVTWNRNNFV